MENPIGSTSREMNLKPFSVIRFVWNDVANLAKLIVPSLTFSSHKGSMGRIGVVGGSRDYTGAPYYAASAALKFGGDLSYIFCSELASMPIKSYSPELMVTPIYRESLLADESSREIEVYCSKCTL